jgi:hypothetical protein
MAKVFHAIQPNFGVPVLPDPVWPQGYELVAELATDDLDDIFRLTNHIDSAWYENEGVVTHKQSRSTSVGDIIQTRNGLFRCMPIGWEKFNEPQPEQAQSRQET